MNLILEFIKENGSWESYPGNARASPRHYTPSTTSGCPFISPQWGPLPPPQLCWSPRSEMHYWHCQSTCWGTKLTLFNGCLTVRNVKWRKPPVNHLQCNSQVERFNRTVEAILAKMTEDNEKDWDCNLPKAYLQTAPLKTLLWSSLLSGFLYTHLCPYYIQYFYWTCVRWLWYWWIYHCSHSDLGWSTPNVAAASSTVQSLSLSLNTSACIEDTRTERGVICSTWHLYTVI